MTEHRSRIIVHCHVKRIARYSAECTTCHVESRRYREAISAESWGAWHRCAR